MTSSIVVNVKKKRITELLASEKRVDGRGLTAVSYTHLTLPTTPYV